MILLEDNMNLFKKCFEHQKKKAELVEFDDAQLALLKKGFQEEDMVSLANSSILSFDEYI